MWLARTDWRLCPAPSFPPSRRLIDLSHNSLVSSVPLFGPSCTLSGSITIAIQNNGLTAQGLSSIVDGYGWATASLDLDASSNSITLLSRTVLGLIGQEVDHVSALTFNLSRNPLTGVSGELFAAATTLSDVTIDISDPTNGSVAFPTSFVFSNIGNFAERSTLVFAVRATGATPAFVASLREFLAPRCDVVLGCIGGCGSTCNLTIDISHNQIMRLGPSALSDARVSTLDLSYNNLTELDGTAFSYTFDLKELILAHNALTVIPQELQDNTPALTQLNIASNNVRAIVQVRNHISTPADAAHNPLTCATYGPTLEGCNCTAGLLLSVHCGYIRCTPDRQGCSASLLFNSSDCSSAPWSSCVNGATVLGQQYYSSEVQAFLPVTQCATAYAMAHGGNYRPAYQVPACRSSHLF